MASKIGTETTSVVNWIQSTPNGQPEPEVGMGCIILMWTDRHAGTIIKVERFKGGNQAGQVKAIHVQQDKAKRTDKNGFSESQTYTYEHNPNGSVHVYKKTVRGWKSKDGGGYLRIGERNEYSDPCF